MSEVESVVAQTEASLEKEQPEKGSPVATKAAVEGAAAAAKATDESSNATAESPPPPAKTPAKRTPSKRMSFIERAQKESEELVKTLGGSLEMEGGRRTRSSNRTPTRAAAVTPPPAKKSRNSPATPAPKGRGRARKIINADSHEDLSKEEDTPEKVEEPSDKVDTNANTDTKNENTALEGAEEKVADAPATSSKEPVKDEKNTEEKEVEKESAKTAADTTDAAPSKAQQEEKQNDVDHKAEDKPVETAAAIVAETAQEPMETDADEGVEAAETVAKKPDGSSTAAAKEAAPAVVEPAATTVNSPTKSAVSDKVPTPEPMEVDSVTISDDSEPQTIDDDTADDVVHVPDATDSGATTNKTKAAEAVAAASKLAESNDVVDLDSSPSELESIVDGAPKETANDTGLAPSAVEENNAKDNPTPAIVANNNDVNALSSSAENDVQKTANAENNVKEVSSDKPDTTTTTISNEAAGLESEKKLENKTSDYATLSATTIPELADGAVSSPQCLN